MSSQRTLRVAPGREPQFADSCTMAARTTTKQDAPFKRRMDRIKIWLLPFGDVVSKKMLESMVRNIQRTDDLFEYELIQNHIVLPEMYDSDHCYSNIYYFDILKQRLVQHGFGFKGIVGFTHESLEGHKFNAHDHNAGVGIITIDDHQKYKPVDMSLEQYVAYLLLCESFCLAGEKHYEHDARQFDLFDECIRKGDLLNCLLDPKISEQSREKLNNGGFPPNSGNNILEYVGKKRIREAFRNTIGHFVPGLLIGGTMGQFSQLLPKDTTLMTRWIIIGVLLTFVAVSVVLNWIKLNKSRHNS